MEKEKLYLLGILGIMLSTAWFGMCMFLTLSIILIALRQNASMLTYTLILIPALAFWYMGLLVWNISIAKTVRKKIKSLSP